MTGDRLWMAGEWEDEIHRGAQPSIMMLLEPNRHKIVFDTLKVISWQSLVILNQCYPIS